MTIIPQKILVIQTAFIGDVILATALLEKIHAHLPNATIDFLVRKGNEGLVKNHPFIGQVLIWEKQKAKYKSLWHLLKAIRATQYDAVINTQRFGATGLLTVFSGATIKSGFKKNPFSFGFTHAAPHHIGDGTHETERNQRLISFFTNEITVNPKLYPTATDFEAISKYTHRPFITISPTSVWFTKQYPADKWVNFIDSVPNNLTIYLLGGPSDSNKIDSIVNATTKNVAINLAGKTSFLESSALLSKAQMNYVNDSGPLHLCSAMNAPVTAVFCSTIPDFGFTPLADNSKIIETTKKLECKPCGLHGHKACPKQHFDCANTIKTEQLLESLNSV